MRLVIQRTLGARCTVDGEVTGAIDRGLVVYAGVVGTDSGAHAAAAGAKLCALRVFADDAGKMNRSVVDVAAEVSEGEAGHAVGVLAVPNFTLAADPTRKGNRPSFSDAAPPEAAERLFWVLVDAVRGLGVRCETGRFGADMRIEAVADGPVTLVLDTDRIAALRR